MDTYRMDADPDRAGTLGLGTGRVELDLATLTKIGSVLAHAREATGPGGHAYDVETLRVLLQEPDVGDLLETLDRLALLPVAR